MKIISIYNPSQYEQIKALWDIKCARLCPAEDLIKASDIPELDILVYHDTETKEILGFLCINNENRIVTIAGKPGEGRIRIWTQLVKEAKRIYSPLHLNISMYNRVAFSFYTSAGFIIDGAALNKLNDTVEYTMIYENNDFS